MTVRAQIGAGVLMGTLVAGPVFVTMLMLTYGSYSPGDTTDPSGLAMLPAVMAVVLPFGAVLALLPVLLGAWLMGWLGCANQGGRLPVAWALAGGFLAGLPTWLLDGEQQVVISLAATGTLCALAARWQTRWVEGELAPRYGRA